MTGNWKVIQKIKKGTPWEITHMPSSFEVRESWGPGPKLNHLTTPAAKTIKLSTKEACFYQNQGPGWEKHQGHIGWCLPKYWTHRFSWTTFKVFNSNVELMTIDLESTAPHSHSLINCGGLSQSIIRLCLFRKDPKAIDKRPGMAWPGSCTCCEISAFQTIC